MVRSVFDVFSNKPRPGRRILLVIVAVVLFLIVFGRVIATLITDGWWYSALDHSDVFWTQLQTKVLLFFIAFGLFVGLAAANLYVADQTAPAIFPANVHPVVERFHELFGRRLRPIRYVVASVIGVMLSTPVAAEWQSWLLFVNSRSFGNKDPQFGLDVGFYVFRLPFLAFFIDWMFVAVFLVLLMTLAAHLLNGGVMFISTWPAFSRSTKTHLAVLLSTLAILKAGDYWITRYELTASRGELVDGATYTVVHAEMPALVLLTLVALLTAYLYLATLRSDRWRPAVVASALWLVVAILGGAAYPAIIESVIVRPNQSQREARYIARNITATRAAYGLDGVETTEVTFEPLTAADVNADLGALQNVRLLNDGMMKNQFEIDRGLKAGTLIFDLDVDRYSSGESADGADQTMITARELNLRGVANTSWPSLHLVSTRGCGLVSAPMGKATDTDRPVYRSVPLARPQLYFSAAITGFAIVGTDMEEINCEDITGPYEGTNGVSLDGFGRRLAFAVAFMDYNLVANGSLRSESQILWHRSVRDRVSRLAPFLELDSDPYPVVLDGTVQWVVDAFTTTDSYPYAQAVSQVDPRGLSIPTNANYVRNSVKAVVDAYTGEVKLYVMDPNDPVLSAWRGAFPKLFTDLDEMPDGLRTHLRYPEDLFTIQTSFYSRYHLAPEDFFEQVGAWSVAQEPSIDRQDDPVSGATGITLPSDNPSNSFARESDATRFVPYYTMFRSGAVGADATDDTSEDFVLFRPFVPFSVDDSRTELIAFMTASGDPENYGQIDSYVIRNEPKIQGPRRVAELAENDPVISNELTNQATVETGVRALFGDMQVVPVGKGMVYVRPVYLAASDSIKISYVIVSYDGSSVMTKSIDEALGRLFPGYSGTVGDRVSTGAIDIVEPDDTETPVDVEPGGDIERLLADAATAYDEAQARLKAGDLGGYQDKMDEVGRLAIEANELLNGTAPTTTNP